MVSKIIKRTPTKSIKNRRTTRRRQKSSSSLKSVAKAPSAVLTSINNSFSACQRRIIKIFNKLTSIGTPSCRKRGYQLLKKYPKCPFEEKGEEEEKEDEGRVRKSLIFKTLLPPPVFPLKRTVFLDLDETLIHSKTDPPPERFDFMVRPTIDGEILNFYVIKRPGVDELLEAIVKKNFEIVIFTAGLKEYASLVLDRIDPKRRILHRLYRDSCKELAGKFVKDLSDLGRDLKNVVLVDDNPNAYMLQPNNALPVRPFIDDLSDRELEKVIKFINKADEVEDIRDAIKSYVEEDERFKVKNLGS